MKCRKKKNKQNTLTEVETIHIADALFSRALLKESYKLYIGKFDGYREEEEKYLPNHL